MRLRADSAKQHEERAEGWRTHLLSSRMYFSSHIISFSPPRRRTPGKGCAQCTVCSTEIRLLQQRSGLAGYRALPDPLTPLAGIGLGREHREGSTEGPEEKERLGRHSTGCLLQDTPVRSLPTNVTNGKTCAKIAGPIYSEGIQSSQEK
ncbi:hypothetical protein XENOCAPTIV_013146 [Xenoophorus captivus]|uniref:Uncharacterized protein n=1 Tax=Xenoophorus captivus TaxID=1517983 RepID=A0ABV0RC98_9TELE